MRLALDMMFRLDVILAVFLALCACGHGTSKPTLQSLVKENSDRDTITCPRETPIQKLSPPKAYPGIECCSYDNCDFDHTNLICHKRVCICPTNVHVGIISVNLEWSEERGVCISQVGSGCDMGPEGIHCQPGVQCVQIPEFPDGMGNCTVRNR